MNYQDTVAFLSSKCRAVKNQKSIIAITAAISLVLVVLFWVSYANIAQSNLDDLTIKKIELQKEMARISQDIQNAKLMTEAIEANTLRLQEALSVESVQLLAQLKFNPSVEIEIYDDQIDLSLQKDQKYLKSMRERKARRIMQFGDYSLEQFVTQFYSEQQIEWRSDYHSKRREYLSKRSGDFVMLELANQNLLIGDEDTQEYERVQSHYLNVLNERLRMLSRSNTKNQKGICVIVPTFNNNKDFRIQYNLNSIFNQVYSNFKVIIVDDKSTDKTADRVAKYLELRGIDQSKAILIRNSDKLYHAGAVNEARGRCGQNDIIMVVNGQDQLIGNYVLQVYNAVYSQSDSQVVYSNYVVVDELMKIPINSGKGGHYFKSEIKSNSFRSSEPKMQYLSSFASRLFRQTSTSDLQSNGVFFNNIAAINYIMLQTSCGKIDFLPNYFYLKKLDHDDPRVQGDRVNAIRNQPRKSGKC